MSPLPRPQKDKDGKPRLSGNWTVLMLILLTVGLVGLGTVLSQRQAQLQLQAQQWEPQTAQGRAAGIEVDASKDALTLRVVPGEEGEPVSAADVQFAKSLALPLELLSSLSVGPGTVAVAYIIDKPIDALSESQQGDRITFSLPAQSKETAGRNATVAILGQPAGLLSALKVRAIDRQGLPVEPREERISADGRYGFYEFARPPADLKFLKIEAKENQSESP